MKPCPVCGAESGESHTLQCYWSSDVDTDFKLAEELVPKPELVSEIPTDELFYCGADPGAKGGIAWVNRAGTRYGAIKMPATERDLADFYIGLDPNRLAFMVERVGSAKPGMMTGGTMFKLGLNYGNHRMALTCRKIRWEEVAVMRWQKEFGVWGLGKNMTPTQKKNVHKSKAQTLFPNLAVTHLTADALLIAEFCRRANLGV